MGMRSLSRREFLILAGGLAVVTTFPLPGQAVGGLLDRFLARHGKVTPPITPNNEFYVTSYRSPPTVRADSWELSIKGLVDKPMRLTYAQLLARPRVSEIVTLECVGNSVAGDAISTAEWQGLSLKSLLDEAGLATEAYDVVFRAADGYSDSIRVERAMAGDVLVAHTMNRVPLPLGHGFPARIIVPGIYGMKSVQWLTEIEVVEEDYKGYYQQKGWTDDATVKTMSRIDLPGQGDTVRGGEYTIRGLAFAGTRGVRLVEISMDEGRTWQPATLEPELSPFAWRFWHYRWMIPSRGRYTLLVRATDGNGKPQSSVEQEPAPDGAAGLHEVTVTVKT